MQQLNTIKLCFWHTRILAGVPAQSSLLHAVTLGFRLPSSHDTVVFTLQLPRPPWKGKGVWGKHPRYFTSWSLQGTCITSVHILVPSCGGQVAFHVVIQGPRHLGTIAVDFAQLIWVGTGSVTCNVPAHTDGMRATR